MITKRFHTILNNIQNDDNDEGLKDLHSMGACIKSYFSEETFLYAKVARELCGASGYLQNSRLPGYIELWSPNVTLEGDGVVMYQQTAR